LQGEDEVDEASAEERAKKADEIKERYGDAIVDSCSKVYLEEPKAIGVALVYFACGCLALQGFDENAEVVGRPKILGDRESCSISHGTAEESLDAIYKNVVWKDSQAEFDRKYGNQERVEIASKLFPPPAQA
jgi:hypothetical protein